MMRILIGVSILKVAALKSSLLTLKRPIYNILASGLANTMADSVVHGRFSAVVSLKETHRIRETHMLSGLVC